MTELKKGEKKILLVFRSRDKRLTGSSFVFVPDRQTDPD